MSKFTYEDILNGKLGCGLDSKTKKHIESPLTHTSIYSLSSKDKSVFMDFAKDFIKEDDEMFYFDYINFEHTMYWYWIQNYTNLLEIIDFKLEDLSADELSSLRDHLTEDSYAGHHGEDEFIRTVTGTMNQRVQFYNFKRLMFADTGVYDEMFSELKEMQKELAEGGAILDEFTKAFQGE